MKNVQQYLKKICQRIREKNLEGTVTYRGEKSHLVRCGCNVISLNTSEYTRKIQVEIQQDGRATSGECVYLPESDKSVLEMVDKLVEQLAFMPASENLPEVKELIGDPLPEQGMSLEFDGGQAVAMFGQVVDRFREVCQVSGICTGGVSEYAVINTASLEPVGDRVTDFSTEVVLLFIDGSGRELRADDCGNSFSVNTDKIIAELEAGLKIKQATPREDIEAGEYDVVFSSAALAQLVRFLNWVLFSGESYDLGSSMHNKADGEGLGSKIFGENINIYDNPLSSVALYPRRVGINGIKRRPMNLIENGVQKNFFHSNKKLATRFGRELNGDQACASLILDAGKGPASFNQLVRESEKPVIYISFLHYMNLTNSTTGEFSCISRFGTYLLQDGRVKSHLYNLRINDSLKRIFNNIQWLSSTMRQVDLSNTYFLRNPTGVSCPAMVGVKGLKITATSSDK